MLDKDIPIINGSGPDESIIGTEKLSISDLMSLRSLKPQAWIDHLVDEIEYVKIPETLVAGMMLGPSGGFVQSRKALASSLLGAPNFVEFKEDITRSRSCRITFRVECCSPGHRPRNTVSLSDQ